MRAFLAVIPPEEVVDQVLSFLEPRRDALAGQRRWRWTRPEHLHVTLAFIPELEEWREEALIEGGDVWAGRTEPVVLGLAGAGAFPDPGSARVLWAGVVERSQQGGSGGSRLPSWSRSLRAVASHAGARVDGTRFTPHLTLARAIGRPGPAGHLLQALDTLTTSSWTADEVHLVRSFLGQGPGGTPRYEVRHTWELSGPPEG